MQAHCIWYVAPYIEDILRPIPLSRKLEAIPPGRSDYVASERLLKPLCMKEDEPKLQRQPEGSGKVSCFWQGLLLLNEQQISL